MLSSCGCFAAELFVFCWLGTRVLDEQRRVHEAFYALPWTAYTRRERRLLQFVWQFTTGARATGFSAANGYVPVNIETFGMLMAKVYSALAFLQNFI